MKKSFISLCLLLAASRLATAQDTQPKDSTEKQVTIIIKTVPRQKGAADTVYVNGKKDNTRKRNVHLGNDWYFDIGMNNYLENGKFPNETGKNYKVKNGLDYFAVGTMLQQQIGKRKSPLFFKTGAELSFNAFMFSEHRTIRGDSAVGVVLSDVKNNISKSKLGVSYLSIPVMFMLDYDRVKRGKLKLGLGGYVGIRLKSWSKVKYDDGSKKKEASDFYMTNIRYGVMGQVGFGWLTIFAKYDLNPLFSSGKGFDRTSDLNALNIGVRI